jgi:hypothetical protein
VEDLGHGNRVRSSDGWQSSPKSAGRRRACSQRPRRGWEVLQAWANQAVFRSSPPRFPDRRG